MDVMKKKSRFKTYTQHLVMQQMGLKLKITWLYILSMFDLYNIQEYFLVAEIDI